jgi:pSer/pThr/pTyr-binding forkhead associated (FHA) protein
MSFKLRIDSGPRAHTMFTLVPGATLRVGRKSDAAVSLPDDQFISGLHLELLFDGQNCTVKDLNSRNGTLLNGAKILKAPVRPGDQLIAGQTALSLVEEIGQNPPSQRPQTSLLDKEGRANLLLRMRTNLQPLYAVLDAARDPRILATLIQCRSEYLPLFDESTPPQLAHFAPYVVALPPESSILETLISIGWGQNWGVFITSNVNGSELHGVLRRLLIAYLPDRHQVLLRFYDPRVLETLFAEPSERQCTAFFSHVNSYLINGRLAQTATQYIRDGLNLDRLDIHLSGHPVMTKTSIAMTTNVQSLDGDVILSASQVSKLKAQERGARADHLLQMLTRQHPQKDQLKDENDLRELVLYGCKHSKRYGISSDKDVADYISLMLQLGGNFDEDTRLPWASELLHQRLTPNEKLSRLRERAYLEHLIQNTECGTLRQS